MKEIKIQELEERLELGSWVGGDGGDGAPGGSGSGSGSGSGGNGGNGGNGFVIFRFYS